MRQEFDGLQGILDSSVIQRIDQPDTAVNQRPVDVLHSQNLVRAQMIHVSMLLERTRRKSDLINQATVINKCQNLFTSVPGAQL